MYFFAICTEQPCMDAIKLTVEIENDPKHPDTLSPYTLEYSDGLEPMI